MTKLKLLQNSTTENVTKIKLWQNSNCNKTQKLKIWQNSNSDKILIKKKHKFMRRKKNFKRGFSKNILTPWKQMGCFVGSVLRFARYTIIHRFRTLTIKLVFSSKTQLVKKFWTFCYILWIFIMVEFHRGGSATNATHLVSFTLIWGRI